MLTEKGKATVKFVLLATVFLSIMWGAVFGWGNTIRVIAYFLGYQIAPL